MLCSDIHVHRSRQKKVHCILVFFFIKNMILKVPKSFYLTLSMYNKPVVAEHHSLKTHIHILIYMYAKECNISGYWNV